MGSDNSEMKLSELETLSDEELNKLYTEEKRAGDSLFLISIRAEIRRRLRLALGERI